MWQFDTFWLKMADIYRCIAALVGATGLEDYSLILEIFIGVAFVGIVIGLLFGG